MIGRGDQLKGRLSKRRQFATVSINLKSRVLPILTALLTLQWGRGEGWMGFKKRFVASLDVTGTCESVICNEDFHLFTIVYE